MAATNLQMNWSAVGFTPEGGTLTPITKVRNVSIDQGGSLITNAADGDIFPTIVVHNASAPRVSVVSANVGLIQSFATGTTGTFTATFNDAKLAAGGSIVYTVQNAVVENTPGGGDHAQFGEATLTMQAYSLDGVTSPIAFTRQ